MPMRRVPPMHLRGQDRPRRHSDSQPRKGLSQWQGDLMAKRPQRTRISRACATWWASSRRSTRRASRPSPRRSASRRGTCNGSRSRARCRRPQSMGATTSRRASGRGGPARPFVTGCHAQGLRTLVRELADGRATAPRGDVHQANQAGQQQGSRGGRWRRPERHAKYPAKLFAPVAQVDRAQDS